MDARSEEALEIFARGDADALHHAPALANHDRLLRLAIDEDRAVQAEQRIRGCRFFEPIDHDRARKWDFRPRELQQFLAHDLRREEPLRLIGQVVERIQRLPLGQPVDDRALETVGGYLLSHVGRVPAAGERFDLDGLNVEVLESERRRINKVRISKLSTTEVAEDAEAKSRPV